MSKTEARIQQEAIVHLLNKYKKLRKILYHIPNEGKRSLRQGAVQKSIGLLKGVPDLCVPVKIGEFGALYIEVKRPGEKPRKEQKEVIQALKEAGNLVKVIDSPEGIIKAVEKYLGKWLND